MRYAVCGMRSGAGTRPAAQQRREQLRLEAAARFARGGKISQIAHDLRVTPGSVRRWHRAWEEGGTGALRSRGPVSAERLSARQFAADQRWMLGRIKTLIGRLFHVGYTVEGTWKLMLSSSS